MPAAEMREDRALPHPNSDAARMPMDWRGLGRVEDLNIDFATADRLTLVTELLACCRSDAADPAAGRTAALALTLSGRIGGLMAIYAGTLESRELPLSLHCPDRHCDELFEVALPLQILQDLAANAEATPELELERSGDRPLTIRRPTGADQTRWQGQAYPSVEVAEATILHSLLQDPPEDRLDRDTVRQMSAQLEDLDPLPAFQVSTSCPACGKTADIPVDLEATLLAVLQREQRALVVDVHNLASHYGWNEEEILALPPHRRATYRRLIEAENMA